MLPGLFGLPPPAPPPPASPPHGIWSRLSLAWHPPRALAICRLLRAGQTRPASRRGKGGRGADRRSQGPISTTSNISKDSQQRECIVLLNRTVLCCIILNCVFVHCTVLCYTVLRCTAMYCTALYGTALILPTVALYSSILQCTVLLRIVLYCMLYYHVLYLDCTRLYCIVLDCTAMYCNAFSCALMSRTVTFRNVLYYTVQVTLHKPIALYCTSGSSPAPVLFLLSMRWSDLTLV